MQRRDSQFKRILFPKFTINFMTFDGVCFDQYKHYFALASIGNPLGPQGNSQTLKTIYMLNLNSFSTNRSSIRYCCWIGLTTTFNFVSEGNTLDSSDSQVFRTYFIEAILPKNTFNSSSMDNIQKSIIRFGYTFHKFRLLLAQIIKNQKFWTYQLLE